MDEPLALITPTQKYYYHANHLYSVAALTNQAGGVVERYRYDTYGNRTILAPDGVTVRVVSSYDQQIGFTGRFFDRESGLYYFRSRYYSGTMGRFVGRDPWRMGAWQPAAHDGYYDGFNLYQAYFTPTKLDPFGEKGVDCPVGYAPCTKLNYKPEGNGCGAADWKGKLIPENPLGIVQFDSPCDGHDKCYGTCGSDKSKCDDDFLEGMKNECANKYGWAGVGPIPPGVAAQQALCDGLARTYHAAVSNFGHEPHTDGQLEACDCCCSDPAKPPRVAPRKKAPPIPPAGTGDPYPLTPGRVIPEIPSPGPLDRLKNIFRRGEYRL